MTKLGCHNSTTALIRNGMADMSHKLRILGILTASVVSVGLSACDFVSFNPQPPVIWKEVDKGKAKTITIKNESGVELKVERVFTKGAKFENIEANDKCSGKALAIGATCTVEIKLLEPYVKNIEGKLAIEGEYKGKKRKQEAVLKTE